MQLELRVAGPSLDHARLFTVLLEQRVAATVIRGTQVAPEGSDLHPAAIVHIFDCDKRRFTTEVWPALQAAFDLTCAYVSVYDRGFHGCVLNYAAPTRCPMAPPGPAAAREGRSAPQPEVVAHSAGLSRWSPHELLICLSGPCATAVRFAGGRERLGVDLPKAADSPSVFENWALGLATTPAGRVLPSPRGRESTYLVLLPCPWDSPDNEEALDIEMALHAPLSRLERLAGRPVGLAMPAVCEATIATPEELPGDAEIWPEEPLYAYSGGGQARGGDWIEALGCGAATLCYQGGARCGDGRVFWLRWRRRDLPVFAVIAGGEPVALLPRLAAPTGGKLAICRSPEGVSFEVDGAAIFATSRAPPAEAVTRLEFEASPAQVGASIRFRPPRLARGPEGPSEEQEGRSLRRGHRSLATAETPPQQHAPAAPPRKDEMAFGICA